MFRIFEMSISGATWQMLRESAGFSQRFSGSVTDGGATIDGMWQLREDDVHWKDDLKITYRRRK